MSDQDHTHPEWQGLLDRDETIIWQGAPDTKLRFNTDAPMSTITGLFITGFSIFWMATASQAGGAFWMFGLFIFFTGLYNALGVHYHDAWTRGQTFYTLTSKRAFIASRTFKGKTLESYPINEDTRVRLEGDNPASIFFAQETRGRGRGKRDADIGFRYIDDARAVMAHIRNVQAGSAA